MRFKQWIGLIVALIFLIVAGVWGVNQNIMAKRSLEQLTGSLSGVTDKPNEPYIAEVDINGVITSQPATSLILGEDNSYNHNTLLNYVDELIEDKNNKGIMLNIDSPGGEVYATDIFYQKLMEYKAQTKRPIYAYVGSMAASGGYFLASAADKIYAGRSSWLGSIGVYMQFMDTTGLEKKIGVKMFLVKAGKNKGMGSSSTEMTNDQRRIYQGLVDDAYNIFTGVVSKGRKMSIDKVKTLADGRVYTATQSLNNGLLDQICSKDDAVSLLASKIEGDVSLHPYTPSGSYWDKFLGAYQSIRPRSDAEILKSVVTEGKSGVLMYYAK